MWRYVISDVNRLFAESATELRNIGHGHVIQSPEGVFVEGRVTLYEADFDAGGQKIILSDEVLFLNPIE